MNKNVIKATSLLMAIACVSAICGVALAADNAAIITDATLMSEYVTGLDNQLSVTEAPNQIIAVDLDKEYIFEKRGNVLTLDAEGQGYEIALPTFGNISATINDIVLFNNTDKANASILQFNHIGPKQTLIISSKKAFEETIAYQFDLTSGSTIEYINNSAKYYHSSVIVHNDEGLPLGYVAIESAVDAVGNPVSAEFIISGDNIELVVTGETAISYPIAVAVQLAADSYSTYFNDSYWVTRTDGVSLEIDYIKSAFSLSGVLLEDAGYAAWSFLKAKHSSSSNWTTNAGFQYQFLCHVHYAKNKSPWNIEPWRPNVSYVEVILASCNP